MKTRLLHILIAGVLALLTTTANAVVLPLESRLGGLAYYDPNLDITWAADANINGLMNWSDAHFWAAGLTIGGVSGWRLPESDVNQDFFLIDCRLASEAECRDHEMGFLYHEENISDAGPGPFSNIQGGSGSYWSETPGIGGFVTFSFDVFGGGDPDSDESFALHYAWAVHDGDVVPIPAAVWLFSSGLLGLIGTARRKAA
jgi:hypothetical protein